MRLFALVLLAACGGSTSTAPASVPSPAPVEPLEIKIRVFRWDCHITNGVGFVEEKLVVPTGRTVRLVFTNPDTPLEVRVNPPAVKSAETRSLGHAESATIELRMDAPGEATWQCPTTGRDGEVLSKTLRAVSENDYQAHLVAVREAARPTTREGKIALGAKLRERKGCVACHTVDGAARVGPSWSGIWGTKVTLADGSTRVVDAEYVRQSILTPTAFARPGFPPSMPAFEGQLTDIEIEALTEYIASLAR